MLVKISLLDHHLSYQINNTKYFNETNFKSGTIIYFNVVIYKSEQLIEFLNYIYVLISTIQSLKNSLFRGYLKVSKQMQNIYQSNYTTGYYRQFWNQYNGAFS